MTTPLKAPPSTGPPIPPQIWTPPTIRLYWTCEACGAHGLPAELLWCGCGGPSPAVREQSLVPPWRPQPASTSQPPDSHGNLEHYGGIETAARIWSQDEQGDPPEQGGAGIPTRPGASPQCENPGPGNASRHRDRPGSHDDVRWAPEVDAARQPDLQDEWDHPRASHREPSRSALTDEEVNDMLRSMRNDFARSVHEALLAQAARDWGVTEGERWPAANLEGGLPERNTSRGGHNERPRLAEADHDMPRRWAEAIEAWGTRAYDGQRSENSISIDDDDL